jgi:hypothetical protein
MVSAITSTALTQHQRRSAIVMLASSLLTFPVIQTMDTRIIGACCRLKRGKTVCLGAQTEELGTRTKTRHENAKERKHERKPKASKRSATFSSLLSFFVLSFEGFPLARYFVTKIPKSGMALAQRDDRPETRIEARRGTTSEGSRA